MKCRNCGEKMKEIDLTHEPKPGKEYACDNCSDYRNKNGEWRSQEFDEPGRIVDEAGNQ